MRKNKNVNCFIFLSLGYFILFMITITVVRGQLQIQMKTESHCTQGLLQDSDNFTIVAEFQADAAQVSANPNVFFTSVQDGSASTLTECIVDLQTECVTGSPIVTFLCYCNKTGDLHTVTMRRRATVFYSLAKVEVKWGATTNTATVPVVFDVNAKDATSLSPDTLNCQLRLNENVTYCCNKIAEPCQAFITFDGNVVTNGTCAHYITSGRQYTFYHNVCGVQSNPIMCHVPEGLSDRDRIIIGVCVVAGVLLIVGCIVGFCLWKKDKCPWRAPRRSRKNSG